VAGEKARPRTETLPAVVLFGGFIYIFTAMRYLDPVRGTDGRTGVDCKGFRV